MDVEDLTPDMIAELTSANMTDEAFYDQQLTVSEKTNQYLAGIESDTFNEEELGRMIDNVQQTYPELDGESPETTLKIYLDSHEYHPVTSKIFTDMFGLEGGSAANPEENKKIALRDYVSNIVRNASEMVDRGVEKLSVGSYTWNRLC